MLKNLDQRNKFSDDEAGDKSDRCPNNDEQSQGTNSCVHYPFKELNKRHNRTIFIEHINNKMPEFHLEILCDVMNGHILTYLFIEVFKIFPLSEATTRIVC